MTGMKIPTPISKNLAHERNVKKSSLFSTSLTGTEQTNKMLN